MQDGQHGGKINAIRLLADMVIHICALQLHEPLTRLDENSVHMCRAACTGVVNTLRVSKMAGVQRNPRRSDPLIPSQVPQYVARQLYHLLTHVWHVSRHHW
jgi:hypothetical protein